jgi:periplasmic protein TonB
MSLTYAAQKNDGSTGKSIAIAVVVFIHVVFLYAFMNGLKVATFVKPFKDTVTVFIPEDKPVETPQPMPEVKNDLPLIDKIVPEIPVPVPEQIPTETLIDVPGETTITTEADAMPPETAPVQSFSIKKRVDPTYPSASRRAGESGTVLLTVTVGPDGAPTDIQIARSSGFANLDQAGIDAVRKWRFAVSGGSSYSRVQLPITFKLENQR